MTMTTMVNSDDNRDGWLLDPLNTSRTECQKMWGRELLSCGKKLSLRRGDSCFLLPKIKTEIPKLKPKTVHSTTICI